MDDPIFGSVVDLESAESSQEAAPPRTGKEASCASTEIDPESQEQGIDDTLEMLCELREKPLDQHATKKCSEATTDKCEGERDSVGKVEQQLRSTQAYGFYGKYAKPKITVVSRVQPFERH
jgi:hypothetical protein